MTGRLGYAGRVGPAQRQPATWALGAVVGGRYRLEALLGAGGFGAVFRATDQGGQGPVAVKILSRAAMLQPDAIARFHREARLAMSLRHPSTVRVLDVGDAGEGTPFIAFELLRGTSLEQRLAAGPMSVEEAIAITLEVLGSLEEAHASHVIHRDVKPANVFLCDSPPGAIKLLDFGVAQETPPGAAMERLTRAGTMIGTPEYMAPEQLAGRPAGPGTDLFAVALVLAEMVLRAPVYQGDPLAICLAKLNGQPPPFPPAVFGSSLLAVLRRATSYELANRYRSADEMRSALLAAGLAPGRVSLSPSQRMSGKFGTQVMELPGSAPGSVSAALAATAPPSLNTPLAVQMRSSQPSPPSALAATAPPSIANPLASTSPDRPRPVRSGLAETVNDPDGSAPRRPGTLAMSPGQPASSPAPAVRTAPARRPPLRWAVVASLAFLLLAAAVVVGYRVIRQSGRL
jgi:serine/threonine protein kinase